MDLTPDEEKFVLKMAELWVAEDSWTDTAELMAELGFDEQRLREVTSALSSKDVWTTDFEGTQLAPKSNAVDLAREIRARREAQAKGPDRVLNFYAWARKNRVTAALIIAIQTAGPIVGLLGGALGLLVWIRGC